MRRAGQINVSDISSKEIRVTFRIRETPIYKHAMDFAVAVDAFAEELPTFRGYLKSQLRRAALSGPLNLTEGAGDYPPKEKARIYRLGKRSIMEAATGLDYAARVEPQMADWARKLDDQALALTAEFHRFAQAQSAKGDRQ
jgi:four helix bundle protein